MRSSRATRIARQRCVDDEAKYSRLKSSTTAKMRNRLPSANFIRDEIERSAGCETPGEQQRGTDVPRRPASLAHREPFLAIDAELFMIRMPSLASNVQTAVSPSALLGQFPQPLADAASSRHTLDSLSLRIQSGQERGTALRVTSLRHQPRPRPSSAIWALEVFCK